MVVVKKYQLPPTALIPNSHFPLLHYPGVLPEDKRTAEKVHEIFSGNGWETQWIWRYGDSQVSHYHSRTHECMIVLTGRGMIRFGVADTSDNLEESTHGKGFEAGGIVLLAEAGDAFIIPAGVAHKTYDAGGPDDFTLLTPGDGHGIPGNDVAKTLSEIKLSGCTMVGAYPVGGVWDYAVGGDAKGQYEKVWSVPKPAHDPVLGDSSEGLRSLWHDDNASKSSTPGPYEKAKL